MTKSHIKYKKKPVVSVPRTIFNNNTTTTNVYFFKDKNQVNKNRENY